MSANASTVYTFTYTDASIKSIFYDAPLTGTPTAPTATPYSANTTQVATTAFVESVKSNLLAGSYGTNTWGGDNLFNGNILQSYSKSGNTATFAVGANVVSTVTYGLYATMSNALYMATTSAASIFSTGGDVTLYTSGASKTLTIAANGSSVGTVNITSTSNTTVQSTAGSVTLSATTGGQFANITTSAASGTVNLTGCTVAATATTFTVNGTTSSVYGNTSLTLQSTSGAVAVNANTGNVAINATAGNVDINATAGTRFANITTHATSGTINLAGGTVSTTATTFNVNGTTTSVWGNTTLNLKSQSGDINIVNSAATVAKTITIEANSSIGIINIKGGATTLTGTVKVPNNTATGDDYAASTKWVNQYYAALAGASFTGNIYALNPLDATVTGNQVATVQWVVNKGYLTSAPSTSGLAPINNPTFTGTVTIPESTDVGNHIAASTKWVNTYYLTSSTASSTYAPKTNPTLTGTVTIPESTDVGNHIAASTKWVDTYYAPKTGSTIYAPLSGPTFTGTISGGSATFTGTISAQKISRIPQYDSGWKSVSGGNTYNFTHNLNMTTFSKPLQYSLYYTDSTTSDSTFNNVPDSICVIDITGKLSHDGSNTGYVLWFYNNNNIYIGFSTDIISISTRPVVSPVTGNTTEVTSYATGVNKTTGYVRLYVW